MSDKLVKTIWIIVIALAIVVTITDLPYMENHPEQSIWSDINITY